MSSLGDALPAGKMHVDEVDTDASLVRRLLAAQFPQWANLPIEPVVSLARSTPCISSATTWSCDSPASSGAPGVWSTRTLVPASCPATPGRHSWLAREGDTR